MKKKQGLFMLLLLASGLLKSQVFTPVKTGFNGVINPVMSWVISSDSTVTSYAFLAGDNYLNNKHYIIARFGKNMARSYFENVRAPFPALYRGDAAAADYNKDGHVDLVMTGLDSYGVPVMDLFKNNGYGNFSLVPGPFVGQYDGSIEWGDYDHDGDMDILVTGKLKNNKLATIIYRNDGGGVFTRIITDVPGVYDGCARWGDFEGNGRLDILITGNDGNGPITAIYKYVNGKYFLLSRQFVPLENSAAACADFDGDGKLDFFVTGKNQYGFPECHMYANLGKAVFKDVSVAIRPLMRGSVDAADYDHDGNVDLLLTGESSERPYTLVYHNNKNFNFIEVPTTIPGVVNGKALWGDFDHDGDMDILISGIDVCYDFLGAVYRNNINPPKQEAYSNSIFINAPTPIYKRGPYYYYVFSSCYCDPSNGNQPNYHMYISNVHLERSAYNLNYRFNDLLLKLVPNWNKTDRGHRTSNGFLTREEAEQSRTEMISSYKATHFKIHYLNW